MKKALLIVLSLGFCTVPGLVLADCPPAASLQKSCDPLHPQDCNWMAPWYSGGSRIDNGDTKAIDFIQAQWGTRVGDDSKIGSTLCFYRGDKGGEIVLNQNNFGNVPMPTDFNWTWLMNNVTHIKVCDHDCHFQYG